MNSTILPHLFVAAAATVPFLRSWLLLLPSDFRQTQTNNNNCALILFIVYNLYSNEYTTSTVQFQLRQRAAQRSVKEEREREGGGGNGG